jgi:hypothetical protein
MYKELLIIAVILILPTVALSQERNSSSITWTSVNTFFVEQGSATEERTSLTCIGGERIEWRNSDGSIRKAFQVIETIGDWISIGNEGSIQYEIVDGNTNGSITIQKNAQGTKALIILVSNETQSYELTLQNQ